MPNHHRLRRWQPYLEGQAAPVSPNWGRLCVLSFRGPLGGTDGLGTTALQPVRTVCVRRINRRPSWPCPPGWRVCRRRSHPRFEPVGFSTRFQRGEASTHMMVHQTEIAPLESVRFVPPHGDGRYRVLTPRRVVPTPIGSCSSPREFSLGVGQDSILSERRLRAPRYIAPDWNPRLRLWGQ